MSGAAQNAQPTPEQEELLKSGINDDLSTQGVASMRSLESQARAVSEGVVDGEVVFPNGRRMKVSDLNLDHEYLSGDHSSIFADTAKYLRDPIPGAMYVWAKANDPNALSKVRQHLYRRVELDELKDDVDLPISAVEQLSTHKTAGQKHYVQMYDVQLMEVPPEAVKRLYKLPAAQAIMKAAGNLPFDQLKRQMGEMSKGGVQLEYTRKEVLSPID